jgi:hypothetical protein
MGIINDFKRLFWVNKAVAKSAADKTVEKGREIGNDFSEAASDAWDKSKKVAEDIGEKVSIKAKEAYHDAKEYTSELLNKNDDWSQKPKTENNMDQQDKNKTNEKVSDSVEEKDKTWDKAKETGKEILDKAVKTSDKAWEKVEDVSEDLWDNAKTVAGNLHKKANETMDSMLEKSKELDQKIQEERDKIDPNHDGWADQTLHDKMKENDSNLKGKDKDDFFEKASRYAEGDYSMGKPRVSKPDEVVDESEGGEIPLPPLPKKDAFDDAILDDDPEKTKD